MRRRESAPHVTANMASPRRTEESGLVLARAQFLRSGGSRELFVGITSWNSALFLPHCIQAVRSNTKDVRTEIVVLDNLSEDGSADIARAHGTNVIEERCTQPDALNRLFSLSRSRYTLLMHVDVILLNPRWFEVCRDKLSKNIVLVSPQDIGCGPFTRPWGRNMPESSFMFFDTVGARKLKQTRWVRRFRLPYPAQNRFLSQTRHTSSAGAARRAWPAMARDECAYVQSSDGTNLAARISRPMCWSDELAYLQYGLGNFYSVDGIVTHYHNWFERTVKPGPARPSENEDGLPRAYLDVYTTTILERSCRGQGIVA